jgi:hypothetical protein
MDDLRQKIEAIVYPNEKGLIWTPEHQVNLLVTLFRKERIDILKRFEELAEIQITTSGGFMFARSRGLARIADGIRYAGQELKTLIQSIRLGDKPIEKPLRSVIKS